IRENSLSGGTGDAIRMDDSSAANPSTNIVMFCNSIQGYAGDGLELVPGGYTGTLNAMNNWWGSATGPTIASNPGATGQNIIDAGGQVVYTPFLTANVDADPMAPGFQCACSVGDTQPPTITCPANITAPGPVVTFPPPSVTDNCPGATATCVPPSGSSFAAGTTTRTFTAP